jgi:tryptophan-rich sensory protein
MGTALWLVWKSDAPEQKKKNAELIFALQLFLNFWWSILFFRFHSPAFAFMEIILLLATIFITIFRFAPISRTAAWLMVPYISWVSFASILNYTIWMMNK